MTRPTDGQKAHDHMLIIAVCQSGANQSYSEVPPHACPHDHHVKVYKEYMWWGCGEKGTLLHCWWECKLVQPLWKTVWRFPQK